MSDISHRDHVRCIAAAGAFHVLRSMGARLVETRADDCAIDPTHFDTGAMHGPHAGMAGWWIVGLASQGIDPEQGRATV